MVPDKGVMLLPVWVIVGIKLETTVPAGTVTVIFVPLIWAVVPETPKKLKPVISLESMDATVTVTVYVAVEASWAVTVYGTGLVKFCAVPDAGMTLAPDETVIVGTKAVTVVP